MEREAGTGLHKHFVGLKSTGLARQIVFFSFIKTTFFRDRMYGRFLDRMNKIL
jgi:hypothetical protein